MSRPKVPLGQQHAALTRLARVLDVNGGKLLGSVASAADRGYVRDGLAGAIATLEFVRDNREVILAAVAAAKSQAVAP